MAVRSPRAVFSKNSFVRMQPQQSWKYIYHPTSLGKFAYPLKEIIKITNLSSWLGLTCTVSFNASFSLCQVSPAFLISAVMRLLLQAPELSGGLRSEAVKVRRS